MAESFQDKVILELIKTGLALFLLFVTWGFGQSILAYWDLRKKQQEIDIAAANKFRELYGEFKTIWRLWKILKEATAGGWIKSEDTNKLRFELLQRAAKAEGEVEAIIVKLATERPLSEDDNENLGLFRQAYQKLREGIRDDDKMEYGYKDPEYVLFNQLAVKVARLILPSRDGSWFATSPDEWIQEYDASRSIWNLGDIMSYRSKDFDLAITNVKPEEIRTSDKRKADRAKR